MTFREASALTGVVVMSALTANGAGTQLMSTCSGDSPERRGEMGCTIIERKLLPSDLAQPLFWHIDRFDSLERARAAVGPASIAFEAAGAAWLMTVEATTSDHHGGRHVAEAGPLPLPKAARYSMLAQSAVFGPGMYSLVHHHPGVEAVYVLEGEACFETQARGFTVRKGETLVVPANTMMRAVVPAATPRRHVLAVIVHDAAQPATMRMEEEAGPPLAACR